MKNSLLLLLFCPIVVFSQENSSIERARLYATPLDSATVGGTIHGKTTICEGEKELKYHISPVNGATYYHWQTHHGSEILTGQGTTEITLMPGNENEQLEVVVENLAQPMLTLHLAIEVHAMPLVFIATKSGKVDFCSNQEEELFAIGASSIVWENGNSQNRRTVNLIESETFTVIGTNEFGCKNTAHINIHVHALPELNLPDKMKGCTDVSFNLPNENMEYNWSTGATSPSLLVAESGLVTVKITNMFGCTNEAKTEVEIGDCETVNDEQKSPSFIIYPNPATESIQLASFHFEEEWMHLRLLDSNGKLIQDFGQQRREEVNRTKIALPDLSAGVYFLGIESEKTSETVRLVIQ